MFYKQFNKKEVQVYFTIISIFITFFIFRILSGNFYLSDSYEYLDAAVKIKNFSFLDFNGQESLYTKRPFVYPLFLVFFLKNQILFILFIQTIIGIYSFFLLFKIIKSFDLEIKKSYLWLFLFTPSIYIYTQLIMAEWLVMFFITLMLWLLIKKWNRKTFAYIQILTLLLAFTKPIFYPLIYLNFIFFGIYFIKKKTFSFWIFIPIIVLQSYIYLNAVKTGYRHFSSIENINLINYNLYFFKSKTLSKTQADLWLNSIYNSEYNQKNFEEQSEYLRKIAIKEIKQNFIQYSYYHFYTSIRGMFDPGRYDLMTFVKIEDGSQGFLKLLNNNESILNFFKTKFSIVHVLLIPIFFTILIKWFYFFKFLLTRAIDFKLYYIILILGCYILITGPVNSSRYMMPFQGVIILFAILGMNRTKGSCEKVKNNIKL